MSDETTPPGDDRKSVAASPDLVTSRIEVAKREALNGLRQFDAVVEQIESAIASRERFRLRPSTLLQFNRIALDGLSRYAGNYRPSSIQIIGSKHQPPRVDEVPALVEALCDYVTDNFETQTALHLAAYTMWRINWIHPFDDGNGRTSRAISYFVLCAKLKARLPGKPTIPELISRNKAPYYKALEAADAAWSAGRINLTVLEQLLEGHLAAQLVSTVEEAKGGPPR